MIVISINLISLIYRRTHKPCATAPTKIACHMTHTFVSTNLCFRFTSLTVPSYANIALATIYLPVHYIRCWPLISVLCQQSRCQRFIIGQCVCGCWDTEDPFYIGKQSVLDKETKIKISDNKTWKLNCQHKSTIHCSVFNWFRKKNVVLCCTMWNIFGIIVASCCVCACECHIYPLGLSSTFSNFNSQVTHYSPWVFMTSVLSEPR